MLLEQVYSTKVYKNLSISIKDVNIQIENKPNKILVDNHYQPLVINNLDNKLYKEYLNSLKLKKKIFFNINNDFFLTLCLHNILTLLSISLLFC